MDKKILNYKLLSIEGTKYRTLLTKKFENRKKWEYPDEKKILSYIPGTILKIFVEEGQTVKSGENLCVLESMKMKNLVALPFDAIIKKIHVKEGQQIPKETLILELE